MALGNRTALQGELNRLANGGTYRAPSDEVGCDLAANQWAGTTGRTLQGALNAKAANPPEAPKEIVGCLNQLAGTTGLGAVGAASAISV